MICEDLSHEDFARLAYLQLEALPRSMASQLGASAAEAQWRFAARSPREEVVVERRHRSIVGAALASCAPRTLRMRLLVSPFALHALARLPTVLRAARRAPPSVPCELVLLFTDPGMRGRGIGRTLLCSLEARLRARGIHEYIAFTEEGEGNPAPAFYNKAGFRERAPPSPVAGFRVLWKEIPE